MDKTQKRLAEMAKSTAEILIKTKSVLIRPSSPFTLTSGRLSPVYVDCRRLIAFPKERSKLMDMGTELIRYSLVDHDFDVVAGGETAGIPYAAWISERLNLPMCYIRKKPKGFGRNARIEGALEEGQRVLLVEDMATDGGSKLSFVEAIREVGASCHHCFVVFHYGIFPQGEKLLKEAEVSLHRLATWEHVFQLAEESGDYSRDDLNSLKLFLDNPTDWSASA